MPFELFGIVKGQPIQSLALCSTLEVAEYHKENTFGDFPGKIIIQESEKTQSEAVQAIYDIAAPVFLVEGVMNVNDWETVKCDIQQTTAVALYNQGTLKNIEQLNQVDLQNIERKKLKATMMVIETEGQPFNQLFAQMQEEVLQYLTKGATASRKRADGNRAIQGDDDDDADTATDESLADTASGTSPAVVEPTAVIEEQQAVVEPTALVEESQAVVEPTTVVEESQAVVEPTAVVEESQAVVEPTAVVEESQAVVEPTAVVEESQAVVEPTAVVDPLDDAATWALPDVTPVDVIVPVAQAMVEPAPMVEPQAVAPLAVGAQFKATDPLSSLEPPFIPADFDAMLNDLG